MVGMAIQPERRILLKRICERESIHILAYDLFKTKARNILCTE